VKRLNAWLDQKKPSQRELMFAAAFDVCAVAVVGLIGAILVIVWPGLVVAVVVVASFSGIPTAVTGQLLSYRVEDRRAARARAS